MNVTQTLDTQIDSREPDIGALIGQVEALLAANGLPHALAQSFALAFDEVISNIAAYGSAREPIGVHVSVSGREVSAQVVDDGVAFDPLQLPDPDVTSGVDERAIGGLGVFLVKKMMDQVAYERRGRYNCLSFTKRAGAPASGQGGDAEQV